MFCHILRQITGLAIQTKSYLVMQLTWAYFNIKISLEQHKNVHLWVKMETRSPYLHNGIFCTVKRLFIQKWLLDDHQHDIIRVCSEYPMFGRERHNELTFQTIDHSYFNQIIRNTFHSTISDKFRNLYLAKERSHQPRCSLTSQQGHDFG